MRQTPRDRKSSMYHWTVKNIGLTHKVASEGFRRKSENRQANEKPSCDSSPFLVSEQAITSDIGLLPCPRMDSCTCHMLMLVAGQTQNTPLVFQQMFGTQVFELKSKTNQPLTANIWRESHPPLLYALRLKSIPFHLHFFNPKQVNIFITRPYPSRSRESLKHGTRHLQLSLEPGP